MADYFIDFTVQETTFTKGAFFDAPLVKMEGKTPIVSLTYKPDTDEYFEVPVWISFKSTAQNKNDGLSHLVTNSVIPVPDGERATDLCARFYPENTIIAILDRLLDEELCLDIEDACESYSECDYTIEQASRVSFPFTPFIELSLRYPADKLTGIAYPGAENDLLLVLQYYPERINTFPYSVYAQYVGSPVRQHLLSGTARIGADGFTGNLLITDYVVKKFQKILSRRSNTIHKSLCKTIGNIQDEFQP